jgi:hypothetical protein
VARLPACLRGTRVTFQVQQKYLSSTLWVRTGSIGDFGRVHQTLRVTPAMEAGVTNHVWGIEDIVNLL